MCFLQNFLHNFSKLEFSNSISISVRRIVAWFSVFCVIFAIACLSAFVYTAGFSNIRVWEGLWVVMSWCAMVVVTVCPGVVMVVISWRRQQWQQHDSSLCFLWWLRRSWVVLAAEIRYKIDLLISSSLVSSWVLVILKQYLRSMSSSYLGRRIYWWYPTLWVSGLGALWVGESWMDEVPWLG